MRLTVISLTFRNFYTSKFLQFSNQIKSNVVLGERGKPEYLKKDLSEQSREPTNSAHLWRRVRESNPGHIGGRRALSPLGQPCSPNRATLLLCARSAWRVMHLGAVVQKLDNAVHWINHYPLESAIGSPSTYPLDSDLSGGYFYPTFEPGARFSKHPKILAPEKLCLYNYESFFPEFLGPEKLE